MHKLTVYMSGAIDVFESNPPRVPLKFYYIRTDLKSTNKFYIYLRALKIVLMYNSIDTRIALFLMCLFQHIYCVFCI